MKGQKERMCKKCGALKPISNFGKIAKYANQQDCVCRGCRNAYSREYYKKNANPMRSLRSSWYAMRDRCSNPKSKAYHHYGGRGITICERWQNFDAFAFDMGTKPPGTSLDRIDNDKGYSPDNCRWATQQQQVDNRRVNVYIEINGVSKTINGWARHAGVSTTLVRGRYLRGVTGLALIDRKPLNRKLNIEQVRKIKELLSSGRSQPSVAREFGISSRSVWSIYHGEFWRDIC